VATGATATFSVTLVPSEVGTFSDFDFKAYVHGTSNGTAQIGQTITPTIGVVEQDDNYNAVAEVTPEEAEISVDDTVTLTYSLENTSATALPDVKVWYYDFNGTLLNYYIGNVATGATATFSVTLVPSEVGTFSDFDFNAYVHGTSNGTAQIGQTVTPTIVVGTEIDYELDSDEDGLPDYLEELLGTDPLNPDTDEDGISDLIEVQIGSDPLIADSTSDIDSDGLSNIDELNDYETNPANPDTDGDGLNDYEEIFTYQTDPTNADTDDDGASDGWEVAKGFNPLVFNDSFEVVITVEEENGFTVSVDIDLPGEQAETLTVEDATDGIFFDDTIPG
jgi:HSP20 family molecular chaperone IbpA